MLLNLSNHPSDKWSQAQKDAAIKQFGGILDFPFPMIEPTACLENITTLASQTFEKIITLNLPDLSIHVMGEFSFCYQMIKLFEQKGIKCFASTTFRESFSNDAGEKISKFTFIMFRPFF